MLPEGRNDRHSDWVSLFVDDGTKAEKIPSGIELQQLFDSIAVTEGELITEAERAWGYGDQTGAEAAANDAKE